MAKIAIIGAGSLVFCKTLMNDFLATPALEGSEYSLMALTHTRLDKTHAFVPFLLAGKPRIEKYDFLDGLAQFIALEKFRAQTRSEEPAAAGDDDFH